MALYESCRESASVVFFSFPQMCHLTWSVGMFSALLSLWRCPWLELVLSFLGSDTALVAASEAQLLAGPQSSARRVLLLGFRHLCYPGPALSCHHHSLL